RARREQLPAVVRWHALVGRDDLLGSRDAGDADPGRVARRATVRTGAVALAASLLAFAACERVRAPGFGDAVFRNGSDAGELRGADMREASGLVASLRHPGHYWLHNDSGN